MCNAERNHERNHESNAGVLQTAGLCAMLLSNRLRTPRGLSEEQTEFSVPSRISQPLWRIAAVRFAVGKNGRLAIGVIAIALL